MNIFAMIIPSGQTSGKEEEDTEPESGSTKLRRPGKRRSENVVGSRLSMFINRGGVSRSEASSSHL